MHRSLVRQCIKSAQKWPSIHFRKMIAAHTQHSLKIAIFLIFVLQHLKDFINCDEREMQWKKSSCASIVHRHFLCVHLNFLALFCSLWRAHLHINQYYVRCVFHVHTYREYCSFSSKATWAGALCIVESLMKNCNDEELCGWNKQRNASRKNSELHKCKLE